MNVFSTWHYKILERLYWKDSIIVNVMGADFINKNKLNMSIIKTAKTLFLLFVIRGGGVSKDILLER